MSQIRMERINEEVRKAVSDIIRNELDDPKISQMTSISYAEVTRDLKFAKIYVSVMDEEAQRNKTIAKLNRAAGVIAREIGRYIDIRRIPRLTFILDTNIEYGIRMSTLIDSLVKDKDGEINS